MMEQKEQATLDYVTNTPSLEAYRFARRRWLSWAQVYRERGDLRRARSCVREAVWWRRFTKATREAQKFNER